MNLCNKRFTDCLKCEHMEFPDMPNGRKDFEHLCSVVGVMDALAYNPNMICFYRRLLNERKRGYYDE